jgi:Ni,Fe-hydrogenase maturation factor
VKSVFVAGNPLVEEDSLALKVAKELGKELEDVEFKAIDSLSEIEEIPDNLCIIDVAKGLRKVEVIRDLEKLQELKLISLHDFDIGTELLLFKKIGKVKNVTIIAIPLGYDFRKAIEESKRALDS